MIVIYRTELSVDLFNYFDISLIYFTIKNSIVEVCFERKKHRSGF